MNTVIKMTRTFTLIGVSCSMFVACSKQDEPVAEAEAPAATVETTTPPAMPKSDSPDGASVFIIRPENGATVRNPIHVGFGISGMDVVAAGVNEPNSGHHHLLIDTDLPNPDLPIPADANHIHFGTGSTSTEIVLEPGEHTLQLLLGDHLHIPHNPPVVSQPITITVE